MRQHIRIAIGLLAIASLAALGGCPGDFETPSPLQGQWLLVSTDEDVETRTLLTFNEEGRLRRVLIQTDEAELETVILRASSTVIGDAVEIETNLLIGRLVFTGNFNSDFTEVIGDATIEYRFPGSVIRVDGDNGRLERID